MTSFSDLLYHATLEQTLIESFPREVFHKLHLPSFTYPTLYQGLPRYSKPLYPKHLFVKEPFAHLPTLKKRCLDKAVLSLYANTSLSKTHTITLFTYVIPGGLGDYFAQQLIKKYLNQAFPHLRIYTLSLLHHTAPKSTLLQDLDHHVLYFSEIETMTPDRIPSSLMGLLRSSSLLLQIPTFYPHWNTLLQALHTIPSKDPMPVVESIGEYGFVCSPDFHPHTSTRCLGLHFLEHGILFDHVPPSPLKMLSDQQLLALLLENRSFQEYQKQSHLYFAYLCTDTGYALYLYSLLLYLADDPKNIDLCTPDIGPFLKALNRYPDLYKKAGIKEIVCFYKNQCSSLKIQDQGKLLRIIHTGPLDHQSFKTLLQASCEPVGIRGNLSLSEAISMNKTYFYDSLAHNTTLYYGLCSMADVLAPHAAKLLKLYQEKENILQTAHSIAHLMLSTPALPELKKLGIKIQEEHSALPHLKHLVLKALKQQENPALRNKESLFIEAFSQGTLSLEEVISSLKAVIKT